MQVHLERSARGMALEVIIYSFARVNAPTAGQAYVGIGCGKDAIVSIEPEMGRSMPKSWKAKGVKQAPGASSIRRLCPKPLQTIFAPKPRPKPVWQDI